MIVKLARELMPGDLIQDGDWVMLVIAVEDGAAHHYYGTYVIGLEPDGINDARMAPTQVVNIFSDDT